MDWNEILSTVTQVLIIPIITITAALLVNLIKKKADEVAEKTDNAYFKSAIEEAGNIVSQAVAYTSQTYVDSLKKDGKFDAKAQKQAFDKAKEAALLLLTNESKEAVASIYGDLTVWLQTKIEQTIHEQHLSTAN
jgi:vacuolar-type H+-ATPase subunit H